MAYSIYNDYKDTEETDAVAIVPVKGFTISKKYSVARINIYPANTITEEEIIVWKSDFTFEDIRDKFFDSTIITFPIEYEQRSFMQALSPSKKSKLIKMILEKAEDIMNVFRYIILISIKYLIFHKSLDTLVV